MRLVWKIGALIALGILIFTVGFKRGFSARENAPPAPSDSLSVTFSAPLRNPPPGSWSGANTREAGEIRDPSDPRLSLDHFPLSVLKEAIDQRMSNVQETILAQFPFPKNEAEMKAQIETGLERLENHFSEKTYWSAHLELPFGKKTAPVIFLFTINKLVSMGEAPTPTNAPPSAPSALYVAGQDLGRNICWSLDAIFPESPKDSWEGGSSGGCLEQLSLRDGVYFATGSMNGPQIEKYYLSLAISIPQPQNEHGKLFLLGTDSQKWEKEALPLDWNNVTEEEARALRSTRALEN